MTWTTLPPCGITRNLFSWICWNILTTQNQKIFESRQALPLTILTKALAGAHELSLSQDPSNPTLKTHKQHTPTQSIPWNTVTCNNDAAWKSETCLAGLAWIFNSPSTLPVTNGSQLQESVSSALMAEGLAIREALLHAQHLDISKIGSKQIQNRSSEPST